MQKKIQEQQPNKHQVDHLIEELMVPPAVAAIMVNRGITDKEEGRRFLAPSFDDLPSPLLLPDMDRAVDLLTVAVKNQQKIVIYGDYDVDGITATSVLYLFLKETTKQLDYYIPDRQTEGYGLNTEAINRLYEQGCQLLITVDTGVTAIEQVEHAKKLGLQVIITDHHECHQQLPIADAIINPKRPECAYPFKGLAGVGVAYRLVQALSTRWYQEDRSAEYLPFVALGTVADLVPLAKDNRLFVKAGLEAFATTENLGLQALMAVAGIKPEEVTAGKLGFQIGPRLNAAGRLGDAKRGVRLFVTDQSSEAVALAKELDQTNVTRQGMVEQIFKEAVDSLENRQDLGEQSVLVVAGQGWHHGVVGIVASRLVERYYRPTIVLGISDKYATGSARSIKGFNLFKALTMCQQYLLKYGGHEMAAGMTLAVDKIEDLRQQLNQIGRSELTEAMLTPILPIDFRLDCSAINLPLVTTMQQLAPYGVGNPEPQFLVEGHLKEYKLVGKHQDHLKLVLEKKKDDQEVSVLEGIAFAFGNRASSLMIGQSMSVAGQLSINDWLGRQTVQMMVRYIGPTRQMTDALEKFWLDLRRFVDGDDGALESYRLPAKAHYQYSYQLLKKWSEVKRYRLLPEELLEVLKSKQVMGLSLVMLPLLVFAELHLISLSWREGVVRFEWQPQKKVELKQSPLYNRVCRLIEKES